MARLIFDTGVLIAVARNRIPASELSDESDAALPAVVVAEYLTGIKADADPARAVAQRRLLEDMLEVLPVEDYTLEVAEHHAELLAHTRSDGRPRGPHDLIIAATARASGRTLLTSDARARFDELPGVTARLVDVQRRTRQGESS